VEELTKSTLKCLLKTEVLTIMRNLKLRAGSKSGSHPQSKGLNACKELAKEPYEV
jgi:hypothetical protein